MRAKVVITDFMGDNARLEEEMFADAGITTVVASVPDPDNWIDEARDADAILTRHAPITAAVIQQLERCRIIARYGTGTDNIDIAAAESRSIVVTNVPGYATSEVADHGWAMALALWRHLVPFNDLVRSGGWQPQRLPHIERLAGRTLGLIGFGRIGSAVARRAMAADMTVIAYDPFLAAAPDDVELLEAPLAVAERANIVSLHAPLTEDTVKVVDSEFLERVPERAVLVNVARGGLLDLDAATGALSTGRLGGLGLDVFDEEPIAESHPLRQMANVILSPHVAYYSLSSLVEAKTRSCEEIITALTGTAPTRRGQPS